jgi:26S proteasome regulatory subunit N10
MVLECVMILIDNSVYSRNGDIIPNRFRAQLDTVGSLITFKTNQNLETSVGLMTMGGVNPKLLSAPSNEVSALFSQFSKIQIEGENHFSKSLQIAQLAMLHRTNKKQHERVIAFVASEIKDSEENLANIARTYKRNGTALDIINLCNPSNEEKLKKLVDLVHNDQVDADEGSHFVNYESDGGLLLDKIKNSPIMGNMAMMGGQIPNDDYLDEELQMVLRISMEEEEKRQKELEQKKEKEQKMEIEVDQTQEQKPETKNEMIIENDVNQYINDPEFIKEILGDLNIDNKDQTIKEVMNWDKNKKDDDNQNKNNKDDKKDN